MFNPSSAPTETPKKWHQAKMDPVIVNAATSTTVKTILSGRAKPLHAAVAEAHLLSRLDRIEGIVEDAAPTFLPGSYTPVLYTSASRGMKLAELLPIRHFGIYSNLATGWMLPDLLSSPMPLTLDECSAALYSMGKKQT